jgi:hypothetical protein
MEPARFLTHLDNGGAECGSSSRASPRFGYSRETVKRVVEQGPGRTESEGVPGRSVQIGYVSAFVVGGWRVFSVSA